MRVDIIQKGKTLRHIAHNGETYVMAPKKGKYTLSLYNDSNVRRLAVVTVDGMNVISGKDGDPEGEGYVLAPWERLEIPGWRRSDNTVAAFRFKPETKSYANQMGKGVNNVGVIGVAVFDEKPYVSSFTITTTEHHHHHHHDYWPWYRPYPFCPAITWSTSDTVTPTTTTLYSTTTAGNESLGEEPSHVYTCSVSEQPTTAKGITPKPSILRRRAARRPSPESVDVGTGYGEELSFETTSVTFDRVDTPTEILTFRYATKGRLQSWGIPIDQMSAPQPRPNPFPGQTGCPAPPGWRD